MKGQLGLGVLGIVLLLVSCSGGGESGSQSATQPPVNQTNSQEFARPLVNQSARVSGTARPVPGLLQPTNAKTRANSITIGRRDPFAALPSVGVPIVASSSRKSPQGLEISPLPTKASANKLPLIPLPPLPTSTASTASLPNLSNSPLPPISVPGVPPAATAPPSRTSLADSIQVNGVVQVSGKWNVIVKEPTASSSRYVAVGEYLENGKVLVKKIVSPGSTDPVVVLQQGGVEIRKSLV